MNRTFRSLAIAPCVAGWAILAWSALAVASPTRVGEPALRLVIGHARDGARGFVAREQQALEQRVLAWPEGVVSMPDSLPWLAEGDEDLAFSLIPDRVTALGADGVLPLVAGRYDIDMPIMLTDGRLTAFLAAGRLDVGAEALHYRTPTPPVARGGTLYVLAGVALATVVLLRALYRRSRRS